jgi:sterol desaturase/sphingolipid hydroxylase (fatty acid hydroxylase superfamily)
MLWFAQLALASAFEIVLVGWQGCSMAHYRLSSMTRSKATDLFFSVLPGLGLTDLWVAWATFGLGYLIGLGVNQILISRFGLPTMESGSLIIDGIIFYFLYSFVFYWNHRLFHIGPLWALHRFHHSASEMSLFNAARQHPLQQAMQPLIMISPVAITGVRPGVLVIVMALHGFQQMLTHANLPHGWGWFGRWIFQSPLAHRIHHAKDRRQANRNFGCLMIWDHIFGTYAEPVADIPIGIEGDLHNRQFFTIDLAQDMRDFAHALLPVRHTVSGAAPPVIGRVDQSLGVNGN